MSYFAPAESCHIPYVQISTCLYCATLECGTGHMPASHEGLYLCARPSHSRPPRSQQIREVTGESIVQGYLVAPPLFQRRVTDERLCTGNNQWFEGFVQTALDQSRFFQPAFLPKVAAKIIMASSTCWCIAAWNSKRRCRCTPSACTHSNARIDGIIICTVIYDASQPS